jgi:hypothetical protein
MRPEDIREFVRRQPFQAFRLTLTDGRTYDVAHPDLAMVGRNTVAVGLPREGDPDHFYDRLVKVALLQILQVEPIWTETKPTNGVG